MSANNKKMSFHSFNFIFLDAKGRCKDYSKQLSMYIEINCALSMPSKIILNDCPWVSREVSSLHEQCMALPTRMGYHATFARMTVIHKYIKWQPTFCLPKLIYP